jgi:hydrogenase expression/formation protein HypC
MCLAVPMKITETDGSIATLEVDGITTTANVSLIENAAPGDYVIIHAGFAIERLDEKEADIRLELFSELAALENNAQ